MRWCVFMSSLPLSACVAPWSAHASSSAQGGGVLAAASDSVQAAHDPVLSFVAAACLLAGVAALVITRGQLGMRAVAIGLGLVVLNYVLAYWAAWVFIPVLIATGAVSLVYAYTIVRKLLAMRRSHAR